MNMQLFTLIKFGQNNNLNNDLASFQTGVDQIYNACVNCGSTPNSTSPEDIIQSIVNIHTDSNNTAYDRGYEDGYNAFYTDNVKTISQTKTLSCSGSGGWGRDHAMTWIFDTEFLEPPEITYTLGGDTGRASNVRISKTINACTITVNMYSQGSSYRLYVYAVATGKVLKS